jgi:D-methionine transport system permease protein
MILEAKEMLMLKKSVWQTLYMVSFSTLFTSLIGIPLGVLVVISRKGHIMENITLYRILGVIINATRSIPFPIFIIFVIPLTRFLIGTALGPTAVIVPLTLAAIVFMARLTEATLLEIPFGVIEAAQSIGASRWQIVRNVLLPEAKPGLTMAVTITVITLVSYSAIAGVVGGGGLGDLAIRYGYHRYQTQVMIATVVILMIFVQGLQVVGDLLVRKFNRK